MKFEQALSQLNAFSSMVIYEFDPDDRGNTIEETVMASALQRMDLLNAYLCAQNAILPEIRHIGDIDQVSPEQWVNWIRMLHTTGCHDLAMVNHGPNSGQYRNESVRIVNGRDELMDNIYFLLAGMVPDVEGVRQNVNTVFQAMEHAYGLSADHFKHFIQLVTRVNLKYFSVMPMEQLRLLSIDGRIGEATRLLDNLDSHYLTGQLNTVEKNLVDGIYKVTTEARNIPDEMIKFATWLQEQLKQIDRRNVHDVSVFLADTSYKLLSIHPFEDGNGRIVTCFLNLLLVSMDYPSIVLYKVDGDEKRLSTSLYKQALSSIETDRSVLAQLIRNRIQDMGENPESVYHTRERARLNGQFTELFIHYRNNKKTTITAEQLFDKLMPCIHHPNVNFSSHFLPEELQLAAVIRSLTSLPNSRIKLSMDLPEAKSSQSVFFNTVSKDTKINVIEQLTALGGGHQDNWTYYAKSNAALLKVSNSDEAKNIADKLKSAGLDADESKIKGTSQLVVQVRNIDKDKLAGLVNDQMKSCETGQGETSAQPKRGLG